MTFNRKKILLGLVALLIYFLALVVWYLGGLGAIHTIEFTVLELPEPFGSNGIGTVIFFVVTFSFFIAYFILPREQRSAWYRAFLFWGAMGALSQFIGWFLPGTKSARGMVSLPISLLGGLYLVGLTVLYVWESLEPESDLKFNQRPILYFLGIGIILTGTYQGLIHPPGAWGFLNQTEAGYLMVYGFLVFMRPSRRLDLGIFFFNFFAGVALIGAYSEFLRIESVYGTLSVILLGLIHGTILIGYTQEELDRKFSITLASLVALSIFVLYILVPPHGGGVIDQPLINLTTFPALMIFLHEQTNRFERVRKLFR